MRFGTKKDTLVLCALRVVGTLSLDAHILALVVPWHFQRSLGRLQRVFRRRLEKRMTEKGKLERLVDQSFRQEYLRSPGATAYDSATGCTIIRDGDHIAVFDGMVYHHAIYLGLNANRRVCEVMDNSKARGADRKSIQRRTLSEFIGGRSAFVIMASRCPAGEDHEEYNRNTIRIAEALRDTDDMTLQTYNALRWNCETFALVCTTRELTATSEQVEKIMNACLEDLQKGQHSFLMQSRAAVLGKSSCVMM